MGAGARPQCCCGCWRAQPDERTGRAPFLAVGGLLVKGGSRLRKFAVDQFGLCVRELVARTVTEFVHAFGTDRLVEAAHLSLEERLAVAVRGRVAAEDVPAVGDEFPSDRASDLVAWLPPVDHSPSPLAELRVRARGEDRLPGFGEEELHVLSSLAVKWLVRSEGQTLVIRLG